MYSINILRTHEVSGLVANEWKAPWCVGYAGLVHARTPIMPFHLRGHLPTVAMSSAVHSRKNQRQNMNVPVANRAGLFPQRPFSAKVYRSVMRIVGLSGSLPGTWGAVPYRVS